MRRKTNPQSHVELFPIVEVLKLSFVGVKVALVKLHSTTVIYKNYFYGKTYFAFLLTKNKSLLK